MIKSFVEILYLTDQDLYRLMLDVSDSTLLKCLKKGDPALRDQLKRRVFSFTDYIGRDILERDLAKETLITDEELKEAQMEMVNAFNALIFMGEVENPYRTWKN